MNERANVVTLQPSKPDAELAAEAKAKVLSALEAVCVAMDEASSRGFAVNFSVGSSGVPAKTVVTGITVARFF